MTYPLLEHAPEDLLKAHNNSLKDYSTNADIANWDLEKSKFKELSKEEALEMAKRKEADKLHLVIGDHVITLTPDGKAPGQYFSDFQVSPDKGYARSAGGKLLFTRLMPGSHLIKIADKIYLPTIVNEDKNLVKAHDEHNKEIDDAVVRVHQLEERRREVLDYIENLKQNGSRATQEAQKEYDDTVKYIRRLKMLIAKLELILQDTSEEDAIALEDAEEKYNELVKQLDEYKDFTDELAAFKAKRGE